MLKLALRCDDPFKVRRFRFKRKDGSKRLCKKMSLWTWEKSGKGQSALSLQLKSKGYNNVYLCTYICTYICFMYLLWDCLWALRWVTFNEKAPKV